MNRLIPYMGGSLCATFTYHTIAWVFLGPSKWALLLLKTGEISSAL